MALRLWTGPSGSGKTRFLFEYVLKEAREHRELNYIVIVPEQYTLSTQRELIRLSEDRGILNVDVLSFARLAYRIFEEVGFKGVGSISIDDMGKNLILRHLSTLLNDDLTVFSGHMDKLGYITEVKSAISEFMQYGINVDRVNEMANVAKQSGRGQLAAKLSDMAKLYKAFEEYIADKYITKEDIISKASRAAHKSAKLKKAVVVFDGFTGFTPVQYDLIESLLRISHDIHVTILTDTRDKITYNTEHELFYLGFKTSEKLKKIAELNNIRVDKDFEIIEDVPRRFLKKNKAGGTEMVTSDALVHLERNLFREYSRPYKPLNNITSESLLPTKAVNTGIGVFTALQPIDEVRKVAVEIQKIIRGEENNSKNGDANNLKINNNTHEANNTMNSDAGQNNGVTNNNTGVRYKNIAIATGDLETYVPIFKRVFKEYDIPYFIDKTQPVLINPFIEYIRSLLDIIVENFSYTAVFRYMRSPLSDYETCDIDLLENFVLKFGIKGVSIWKTDWNEKYSWYLKNLKEDKLDVEKNKLLSLNNIREKLVSELSDIINLITQDNQMGVKKPTKTVKEINAVFMRVFETLKIENRMNKLLEEYSITDDSFEMEHKKEYEKIYELIITLMDRMSELLGEENVTLKEYGELLDAGFDEIRIGLIPTITDYIQIGDVTRSRFDDVHTLFIVGANDGVIPKSSSSNGIISDIEKEFLITSTPDIELSPTVREKAYTGQLYLYMLMTKPSSRLFVSYSKLNSNSESIRPSYIIKVLLDMFPGLKVNRDDNLSHDRIFNNATLYDVVSENVNQTDYEALIRMLVDDPEYGELFREKLLRIVDASYMSGILEAKDTISKTVASILYGKSIIGSVTNLEQYARCSFNYFLKYGLSLKERELFSFESKDLGTILHGVLEKYSTYLEEGNLKWEEVSEDKKQELISKAILECTDDPKYSVLQSTYRHKYMVERINRIANRSISVLTNHLKAGKFSPIGAEINFSTASSLESLKFKLSDDEIMRLRGTIDRVDVHEDENDHVYIKVIDYKSGNKSLDLIEVFKGLSLQLVVYMNVAMEIARNKAEYENKDIIPAGILYYHIDDPMVDGEIIDSDEDIESKIYKELKMKGLVNEDDEIYKLIDTEMDSASSIIPVSITKSGDISKSSSTLKTEDFKIVSEYVNEKIKNIGREILSGNIKAEPHTASGVDYAGCNYCPYMDICKFDGTYEADESEVVVTKENVLENMRESISSNIDMSRQNGITENEGATNSDNNSKEEQQ